MSFSRGLKFDRCPKNQLNCFVKNFHLAFLQVERDGVTFSPGTKEIDLIHGDVPRGLDNGIMEAPWIIYREPFYYLFYSTSFYFNPHYNVKVARSLHVTGPYHKHPGYVLKVNGFKLERGATKFVGTGKNNKPFQNRLGRSKSIKG